MRRQFSPPDLHKRLFEREMHGLSSASGALAGRYLGRGSIRRFSRGSAHDIVVKTEARWS